MRLRTLILAAIAILAWPVASAGAARRAHRHHHRKHGLQATIIRTRYGVPHITASNYESLGFGFGYAFASDDLCTIAESYVTVAGQRSRYFGPNGSWTFSGNGTVNDNLDSDFFYGRINASKIVERLAAAPPPAGPLPAVRQMVRGYVLGYNAYLHRTGVGHLPDPRCRGAAWVRPISVIDVYRRFYQLGSLASSGAAIDGIGSAEPVLNPVAAATAEQHSQAALANLAAGKLNLSPFVNAAGSNAIGLGSQATSNGMGMVLANPHFPWFGSERLYQVQLRIPGKLDVTGSTLYGVPLVLIGQTRGLAWSHTVATAWRFTPYELTLAPNDPHAYIVDGQTTPMHPTPVTVEAKQPDGSVKPVTRTLYDTQFGPLFTSIEGVPLPWTSSVAWALGDVNASNFRFLNHFLLTDQAQSVQRYDWIERHYQGIPWVNSIAADRRGHAYYTMGGAIPFVTDAQEHTCAVPAAGLAVSTETGIPFLDGSRSACHWQTSSQAAASGILPPSMIPTLERSDFVENSNDSHWLANPQQPLEGFQRVVGDERTERSLRTRLGLLMIEQRLAGTDGLPGRGFTLADLAALAISDRVLAGELWRDPLVAFCRSRPLLLGSTGSGRRQRGVSGAGALESSLRTGLGRRDAVPPIHRAALRQHDATSDRHGKRSVDGRRQLLHQAVRSRQPGLHPQRVEHAEPARRSRAGRRGVRSAQGGDPARRADGEVPVRRAPGPADPDPRRPRRPVRRLRRHQLDLAVAAGLSGRAHRLELHGGDGICAPRLPRPAADVRDLLRVREPRLASQLRLHAGLLTRAMGAGAVLLEAGQAGGEKREAGVGASPVRPDAGAGGRRRYAARVRLAIAVAVSVIVALGAGDALASPAASARAHHRHARRHHRRATGRIEIPVRSASPDARIVKESYVRLHAPLPAADGAHPAACDWIGYLRFRSAKGPRRAIKADAIFVTMPGIFAGAGSLDQFARNVVRAALLLHRHVEVWALDRRSNCLEDHSGIQAAARAHDPKLAFDYYYHGATVNGRRFAGFATPQQAQFLSGVGLAQTVRDEYTVITREVPASLRTKKVFCGGHSLGGPLTAAFADWDFGGSARNAGYNQCAAYFALDTRLDLATPGSSGGGSGSSSVGLAPLTGGLSNGSPYVNAPPFTPENIEAVPLTSLAAFEQPDQESQIASWLPDDANFQASYRLLFSSDAVDAVTQTPSWRDFRVTNEAALGGIFDNNSSPIVILRAGLGTFTGGPVQEKNWPAPYGKTLVPGLIDGMHLMIPSAPHGPLYRWLPYNGVGRPGAPVQLDNSGQPYTTRADEVTDIHQFARAAFDAPADFVEQYFPMRLLTDEESASNGDRSGDLAGIRYDGIAKHPAFYADAGAGIEVGAAPPPQGPAPQVWIKLPGYHHLDVGAAAWHQNNGRPEAESAAIVRWMARVLAAEHPARRHKARRHRRHR